VIRFAGMDVIVHRPQTVVRTWKERLFSRPWRPLQRTKVVGTSMPDDGFWVIAGQIHSSEKGYDALMKGTQSLPPSTGYPFTSNGNGWAQRNG
jgi:hypothetical protein